MEKNNLKNIDLKISYKTSSKDNPINEFYIPCLEHSNKFYRSVGYFRSSIFLITGQAVIDFAKRGGEMFLICSPELTQEDIDTISKGKDSIEGIANKYIKKDIEKLLEQSEENYSVKILATLLKVESLKIKIALKEIGNGIYHAKSGIFSDIKNNQVSFIGSANETWNAWDHRGNHEIIEVFSSWEDSNRVSQHKQDFDDLWNGNTSGITTIEFPDAMKEKLLKVAKKNLIDLDLPNLPITPPIIVPVTPPAKKKKIFNLFKHQEESLNNWKLNNYRGIFEHATGSGKTVTALRAVHDHLQTGGPVLILVPSKLLFIQWKLEIQSEIDDIVFMLAGNNNNKWKKDKLWHFVKEPKMDIPRVVLAIMDTASSDEFLSSFQGSENLLLIADEVHQIGSNEKSKSLNINAQKRLGLSATPKRYGDPEGTEKIIRYFEKIIDPIFTLNDAIEAKRLVPYNYFPGLLHFTREESEQWSIETKKISKEIAISSSKKNKTTFSNRAKMLLIQRSRIAKKSRSKIKLAKNIIKTNYEKGQKWLIYCEDTEQLSEVKREIENFGHNVYEYFSNMEGDNSSTLELYEHSGGILVSIKCLDEGVDIPSISHAIILASSQNPRQFIQRRGRVLRVFDNEKTHANIYDALITPINIEDEADQISLLKAEIQRAFEFAKFALNPSAANSLKLKLIDLGVNWGDIIDSGFEEIEE